MEKRFRFLVIVVFAATSLTAGAQAPPQQAIYYQEAQRLEAEAAHSSAQSVANKQILQNAANQNGTAANALNSAAPIIQQAPAVLGLLGKLLAPQPDGAAQQPDQQGNQTEAAQQQQISPQNLPVNTPRQQPVSRPVFNSFSDLVNTPGQTGTQNLGDLLDPSATPQTTAGQTTANSYSSQVLQDIGNADGRNGVSATVNAGVQQNDAGQAAANFYSGQVKPVVQQTVSTLADGVLDQIKNGESIDLKQASQDGITSTISDTAMDAADQVAMGLINKLPEDLGFSVKSFYNIFGRPGVNMLPWNANQNFSNFFSEQLGQPLNQFANGLF